MEFRIRVLYSGLPAAGRPAWIEQGVRRSGRSSPTALGPPLKGTVVVPVVVYNGVSPWSAKLDVHELVEESPGAIAEYHPRLRYKLIEARSCGELDDSRENLSDVMFRLNGLRRKQTQGEPLRSCNSGWKRESMLV